MTQATAKINKYAEMKREHQAEIENFPMFFAFSNEQFDENIKKVGLTPKCPQICLLLYTRDCLIHIGTYHK